jgi:hypothetical protein
MRVGKGSKFGSPTVPVARAHGQISNKFGCLRVDAVTGPNGLLLV